MAFVKITYYFKWENFMVCKLYFNKNIKNDILLEENSNNRTEYIKK